MAENISADTTKEMRQVIPQLISDLAFISVTNKSSLLTFCEKIPLNSEINSRIAGTNFETLTEDILLTILTTPTPIANTTLTILTTQIAVESKKQPYSQGSENNALKHLLKSKEAELAYALQDLEKARKQYELVKDGHLFLTQARQKSEERCRNLEQERKRAFQEIAEAQESLEVKRREVLTLQEELAKQRIMISELRFQKERAGEKIEILMKEKMLTNELESEAEAIQSKSLKVRIERIFNRICRKDLKIETPFLEKMSILESEIERMVGRLVVYEDQFSLFNDTFEWLFNQERDSVFEFEKRIDKLKETVEQSFVYKEKYRIALSENNQLIQNLQKIEHKSTLSSSERKKTQNETKTLETDIKGDLEVHSNHEIHIEEFSRTKRAERTASQANQLNHFNVQFLSQKSELEGEIVELKAKLKKQEFLVLNLRDETKILKESKEEKSKQIELLKFQIENLKDSSKLQTTHRDSDILEMVNYLQASNHQSDEARKKIQKASDHSRASAATEKTNDFEERPQTDSPYFKSDSKTRQSPSPKLTSSFFLHNDIQLNSITRSPNSNTRNPNSNMAPRKCTFSEDQELLEEDNNQNPISDKVLYSLGDDEDSQEPLFTKRFSFGKGQVRPSIESTKKDTPKYRFELEQTEYGAEFLTAQKSGRNSKSSREMESPQKTIQERDEKIKVLNLALIELQQKIEALELEREGKHDKTMPIPKIIRHFTSLLKEGLQMIIQKIRKWSNYPVVSPKNHLYLMKQRLSMLKRNGREHKTYTDLVSRNQILMKNNSFAQDKAKSKIRVLEANKEVIAQKLKPGLNRVMNPGQNQRGDDDSFSSIDSGSSMAKKIRRSTEGMYAEYKIPKPNKTPTNQSAFSAKASDDKSHFNYRSKTPTRLENVSHIALSRHKAKALFKMGWLALFAAERAKSYPSMLEKQRLLGDILATVEDHVDSSWSLDQKAAFVIDKLMKLNSTSKGKFCADGCFKGELQENNDKFSSDAYLRMRPLSTDTSRLFSIPSASSSSKTPKMQLASLDELRKQVATETFSYASLEENSSKLGGLMSKSLDQQKVVTRMLELWSSCKQINDIQQESLNELVSSIRGSSEVLKKVIEGLTSKAGFNPLASPNYRSENPSDSLVLVKNNLKCLEQILTQYLSSYFNLFKQASRFSNELFTGSSFIVQEQSSTIHRKNPSRFIVPNLDVVTENDKFNEDFEAKRDSTTEQSTAKNFFGQEQFTPIESRKNSGLPAYKFRENTENDNDFLDRSGGIQNISKESSLQGHDSYLYEERSQQESGYSPVSRVSIKSVPVPSKKNHRTPSLFVGTVGSRDTHKSKFNTSVFPKGNFGINHDRSLSEPFNQLKIINVDTDSIGSRTFENGGVFSGLNQSMVIHDRKESNTSASYLMNQDFLRGSTTDREPEEKSSPSISNIPYALRERSRSPQNEQEEDSIVSESKKDPQVHKTQTILQQKDFILTDEDGEKELRGRSNQSKNSASASKDLSDTDSGCQPQALTAVRSQPKKLKLESNPSTHYRHTGEDQTRKPRIEKGQSKKKLTDLRSIIQFGQDVRKMCEQLQGELENNTQSVLTQNHRSVSPNHRRVSPNQSVLLSDRSHLNTSITSHSNRKC